MSVSRSVQPCWRQGLRASARPRLPEAPVSRIGTIGQRWSWFGAVLRSWLHRCAGACTSGQRGGRVRRHERKTIAQAAAALAKRRHHRPQAGGACLERIEAPAGEGRRAFVRVYAEQARASADAMDPLRRAGRAPGPLAGIPISVKDLFDVAGETTAAGSRVLAEAKPATRARGGVAALLAAGLIPVGRTNMTEFAFSGIGINPHYGTPRAPGTATTGHIPGGSSSGAAVSVADGMAFMAPRHRHRRLLPHPRRLLRHRRLQAHRAARADRPASCRSRPSLDSVGPLANTVALLRRGRRGARRRDRSRRSGPLELRGLRLAVPGNMVHGGHGRGRDRAVQPRAEPPRATSASASPT